MKMIIAGEPKGKARPRFSRTGAVVRTYTPDSTTDYEQLVRSVYRASGGTYHENGYIRLAVRAYFAVPKSATKKRRAQMLCAQLMPAKKPDIDNIVKIIMDGLNGVAYKDDAQVVSIMASKAYSDTPRVEMEITAEGEENTNG